MSAITKFFLALCIFLLSYNANAQAIYGHCIIQNITLDELTCYGPADISNTMIKGKLSVTGPLNLNKSDIKTLEVKGAIDINNSIIHDKAMLYGTINITNTQFMNDIYAETNQMQLTQSTIKGDINIRAETQQPILEMKEHAVIDGNVGFTIKEGIVKILSESEIKGSINNGKKEETKPQTKTDTKPSNS